LQTDIDKDHLLDKFTSVVYSFSAGNFMVLTASFMKRIHLGQGFIVFILFFGIALLDALHSFDWLRIFFWIGMGSVFVLADNLKRQKKNH
jgi:hypothetical protein